MGEGPPFDATRKSVRRRAGEHGQFVGSSSFLGHTLPEGTKIGGLEITGLIGEGGFGIVYLAYDESLQRELAVKEYMPSSLASRASGSFTVNVKSERHAETFRAGLKSFVNEARLLAKFDHPSLLKVYRFWEANGTAYMAMPYYEGPTLKAALAARAEPPDETQLRAWLLPLLDALQVMHEAHCFHRDIAPDNILLTPSGPLLLDFGAARRVIGDMTHALTVVLKPGYAPIEQYGDSPSMTQGAWTDLYALACVVHYAVTGKTPMSSVERMMSGDVMAPLSRIAPGRYSDAFVRAIDAALAIMPRDRPQSVAQFRAVLDAGRPKVIGPRAAVAAVAMPTPVAKANDLNLPPAPPSRPVPLATPPAPAAPPLPPVPPAARASEDQPTIIRTDTWSSPQPVSRFALGRPAADAGEAPRLPLLWVAALGGLALATIGAIWLIDPSPRAPAEPNGPAAIAQPAPAPAPSPPPAATTTTATTAPAEAAPTQAAPAPMQAAPAPAEAVATVPEAAPLATPPALASGTGTSGARPSVDDAASAPVAALGEARPPKATTPARAAPDTKRPTRVSAAQPPPMTRSKPSRCSDILQKASLEPLSAEEDAYLRRECR